MKKYKWQDWFLMIMAFSMAIFLIPQMIDCFVKGVDLNPYTTFLTSIFLYIAAYTYYSMKLRITVFATIITATMWLILFILSIV